jgi:hypothetical protein
MKTHKNTILIIALLFISNLIYSQENKKSDAGGWPERSEIIGFWKMVDFPNREKMNKVDPWPQPYQWFAFYEDGRVFSMMTSSDGNYSKKELEEIFEVLPKQGSQYFKYNGKFLILTIPDIEDYKEIWGMNLFAKDIGSKIKKGDLMMSLDDGNGNGNKSIIYYRLLRKIE